MAETSPADASRAYAVKIQVYNSDKTIWTAREFKTCFPSQEKFYWSKGDPCLFDLEIDGEKISGELEPTGYKTDRAGKKYFHYHDLKSGGRLNVRIFATAGLGGKYALTANIAKAGPGKGPRPGYAKVKPAIPGKRF